MAAATGVSVPVIVGTKMETPRALTAGSIARAAAFFSLGTNDLMHVGYGFSRDYLETSFFSAYRHLGVFGVSPFKTTDAVGRLSGSPRRKAASRIRAGVVSAGARRRPGQQPLL